MCRILDLARDIMKVTQPRTYLHEFAEPGIRVFVIMLAAATFFTACGGTEDSNDPRLKQLRDGELPVDNLIIYDRGTRRTLGLRVLGDAGSFELVGPTIVYVFRELNPGDAEQLHEEGIAAEEHTAYLLGPGESPTLEAMQHMQRIGPIDRAMSDEQLEGLFRLGEAPLTATAPPKPAAFGSPVARSPQADSDVLISQFNEAQSRLLRHTSDGTVSEEDRAQVAELQRQLTALPTDRNSKEPGGAADTAAPEPIASAFQTPGAATCDSYNRLDQSAAATISINRSLEAYAEGFSGPLIDYNVCGAEKFDKAGFISHLLVFCAAAPQKEIQDSVLEYVCKEPF